MEPKSDWGIQVLKKSTSEIIMAQNGSLGCQKFKLSAKMSNIIPKVHKGLIELELLSSEPYYLKFGPKTIKGAEKSSQV